MAALSILAEDLTLEIASFLSAKDLLEFHCVSLRFSSIDTTHTWRNLCEKRWKPWPRYELTQERLNEFAHSFANVTWKNHYRRVDKDATSNIIKKSDLTDLCWYIRFVLSGVRGETSSEMQRVEFSSNSLFVPGYPPLTYHIVNETPPPSSHIRKSRMGDNIISTKQWLKIADFPPHFITRRLSNAEWLVANDNVTLVSCMRDTL